jgi:hypothetical protein
MVGPSEIDAQYYYSYKAAAPDSPVSKQVQENAKTESKYGYSISLASIVFNL